MPRMPNYSFYVALACACVDVLCLTVICAHRCDFTGAREVTSAVDVANKHHTWTRFEAETHFIIFIFIYLFILFSYLFFRTRIGPAETATRIFRETPFISRPTYQARPPQ